MLTFHYNRQTNGKVYYFGIFTILDFFVGLIASVACFCLFKSVFLMLGYMLLHMSYLILLRVGKPDGYDAHLFNSLWTPKVMRPGKLDPLPPYKLK
jgi:hypothetical protein